MNDDPQPRLPRVIPPLPVVPAPQADGITPLPLTPEEHAQLVDKREREEQAAAYDLACRREQRRRFLLLALPLAAWGWWSADWPCIRLGETPMRGASTTPFWLEPLWALVLVGFAWTILKQQWILPISIVLGASGYLLFYVGLSNVGLLPLNAVTGLCTGLITIPICAGVALWAMNLE